MNQDRISGPPSETYRQLIDQWPYLNQRVVLTLAFNNQAA
jgi:hypothetical protein